MENSVGSYSEPGTRNNYQDETSSPMVRDDDDGGVKAWEVTVASNVGQGQLHETGLERGGCRNNHQSGCRSRLND